jgi:hypothetical protein
MKLSAAQRLVFHLGAYIGDVFLSIIQTCIQAEVNVFEYLNVLHKNARLIFQKPNNWLPWNFKETLAVQCSN